MFQIDDYDVFVFDFDGTIMDTEYLIIFQDLKK